jgi:hypothetical protein
MGKDTTDAARNGAASRKCGIAHVTTQSSKHRLEQQTRIRASMIVGHDLHHAENELDNGASSRETGAGAT